MDFSLKVLRENGLNFLLAYGILFIAFLPLEKLFPRHRQKVLRREYGTDLLFMGGQYLLWTTLVVSLLAGLHSFVDALPLADFRAFARAQPLWLQIPAAVLLGDFLIYWGHRLSHRWGFLWRFHRVHHTAEELDWLAAYREHPLDNLFTRTLENLPAILMGFPLEFIAGFVAFRGAWGLYIHSNVAISAGPLKYILGSPELHHWHHETSRHNGCNFANLMPLMDLIFGTYHDPRDQAPEEYGIQEKVSHNYFVQMVSPLLPERLSRRLGWLE